MGSSIGLEGVRQQFLVEGVDFSLHHGLVKVEIESGVGTIDLLLPFNIFFTAVREATGFAEQVAEENRSRVVHACPACVCRGIEPI